jgi:predicted MPP superfamily phosphohydrolase
LIDLLLLRFIWRSSYTPLLHFLIIAEQGLLAAPLFALTISKIIEGTADRNLALHGLAWHGTFFLFASAFLMFRQRRISGKQRRYMPSLLLITGLVYFALAVDALLIEPTGLVIRETTITTSKINEPITIVFCADLQTDRISDYERRTLQKIKEQNADLILFGGDYIQGRTEEDEQQLVKDWNQLFKEINLHAPLGIYAVQGNQEYFLPWREMFVDTAIIPHGTTVTEEIGAPEIGNVRVTFLSLRGSAAKRSIPDAKREDSYRIIGGHMPIFALAAQDAVLLLAGHTHGGQVQLPFIGPLITNSGSLPRKWASGITPMPNGATLIVAHGSGYQRYPAPRLRFLCRPDIWVIRLEPTEARADDGGQTEKEQNKITL